MPKDFPVTVSGKVGKFLNDALTKFDYELGQIDPVVLLFVSDPKDSSFNGVKKVHQFAKMGNSDMSTEIVFE